MAHVPEALSRVIYASRIFLLTPRVGAFKAQAELNGSQLFSAGLQESMPLTQANKKDLLDCFTYS